MSEDAVVLDKLEKVYIAFSGSGDDRRIAELMLFIRSRLTEIAEYDPISGDALPSNVADVNVWITSQSGKETYYKDRIFRIVEHTSAAIRHIAENMLSKIIRTHEIMPIYSVREIDSASIQWLAMKPGRTIMEKLSGNPKLKAVKRKESFDTAENKLFKIFLQELDRILEIRRKYLNDEPEIYLFIQHWLRSDVCNSMGPWINILPNNILLQDKNYKKIWDSWRQLQDIDANIKNDFENIRQNYLKVLFWEILSLMSQNSSFRLLQKPVSLDYADYSFSVKGYLLLNKSKINNNILYRGEFDVSLNFNGEKYELKIHFLSPSKIILISYEDKELRITYGKNDTNNTVIDPTSKLRTVKRIAADIIKIILVNNRDTQINNLQNNIKNDKKYFENAVIDLLNVNPQYYTENNIKGQMPYSLIQQIWKGGITINCGSASAVDFSKEIKTLSLRNLFYNDISFTAIEKNNTAMEFAKKMKEYLNVDKITYLIPDWASDFDLENIRKGMNYYFEQAYSIPQSIAALSFYLDAYISNKELSEAFNPNIIYVILDIYDKKLTITPVKSYHSSELEEKVPKTKGIYWERHPTIIIDLNENIYQDEFTAEIYKIFGIDYIENAENTISMYNKMNWIHLPENVDLLKAKRFNIAESIEKIKNELYKNEIFKKGLPVKAIILDKRIELSGPKNYSFKTESLLAGAMNLSKRQIAAGNIPLWRDHLPELALKTKKNTLYNLVGKNTVIDPERRKRIEIEVPIPDGIQGPYFISLPANSKKIDFQLIQGQGSKTTKYYALLESPAFPLLKETICRLKLTYMYGDEKPYHLLFIPEDQKNAGFNSIEVQWRTKDELPVVELIAPEFPKIKTWNELTMQINECINNLESMFNKKTGILKSKRQDKNNADYCNILVDNTIVRCYKNMFFDKNEYIESTEETLLYLNIEERVVNNKKQQSGKNISTSESGYICSNLRSIRSTVSVIWNGHSLQEIDAPQELREKIVRYNNILTDTLKVNLNNQKLFKEIMLFLSYMHKDMPMECINNLVQCIEDNVLYSMYSKEIAYAIGDASIEWQKKLLKYVLNNINIKSPLAAASLRMLSIALWKNEKLIYMIENTQAENIINTLKNEFKNIINNRKSINAQDYVILTRYFELLLALLRKRTYENKILLPESEIVEWFESVLDKIEILLKNYNGYRIISYLEFDNKKKDNKIPDILLMLRQYLTCKDDSNTIKIVGIDFEEEKSD